MVSLLAICTISLFLAFGMAEDISFEPEKYDLPDPPQLIVNRKLAEAQTLFADSGLKGLNAQTLVPHRGRIFVAARDGWVHVIRNGNIRPLASISSNTICVPGEVIDVTLCGEPTGMVMGPNGVDLYIVDGYLGVTIINSVTGERDLVFAIGTPVRGVSTKTFDDIAVKRNGDVYVCEGSAKWSYQQLWTFILESGRHGRVLKIRRKAHRVRASVVMDGIAFCSGLALMRNERSILVSDSLRARILRHYISGPQKGKTVTFADNLPGLPDNIRPSSHGGFWVPLWAVRDQHIVDVIDTLPEFRFAMSQHLTDEHLLKLFQDRGMIIEMSSRGKILRNFQDLTAEKIGSVLEVNEQDGFLYLGSFTSTGIGKLCLDH